MNTWRHLMIVGAGFAALASAQENPQAQHVTVPFRDAAAPRKLEVRLMTMAALTVRGTERTDVAIDYTVRGPGAVRRPVEPPPPGMHRIGGSSALDVSQDGNVVRVNGGERFGSLGDVNIQVPTQTSVTINLLGGNIVVENIAGEIEVNELNGEITVTNAAGPVVAHSTNGKIVASLSRLTLDKSMSFSTFNGDIDLTLPADAKATLEARADNGEIFTDFDVKVSPQTTAPPPPAPPAPPASSASIRDQVREQVRGALKTALKRSRSTDYVEGTINGGGPEIQFTTFNGRILIHKK